MRPVELGEFLRSRRTRARTPGTTAVVRRSPGMRREELAAVAGITHSWLVKIEQGRANAVSPTVLAALARALELDDVERTHLFALAGHRLDPRPLTVEVTSGLRAILGELEPNPAYILNRMWDIIAWNRAEELLFPPLRTWSDGAPNLLRLVFGDPELATLMVDLDEERRRLVSQFRNHAVDWPDDPDIAILIDQLRTSSDVFRELWDSNDVGRFTATHRHFAEGTGVRTYEHHRFAVLDQPGLQLVVYTSISPQ